MSPSQREALSLERHNLRWCGDLPDHDLNCARKWEDGASPTQTVRKVPRRAKTYAAIGSGDRSLKIGAGGPADDLDINQALWISATPRDGQRVDVRPDTRGKGCGQLNRLRDH